MWILSSDFFVIWPCLSLMLKFTSTSIVVCFFFLEETTWPIDPFPTVMDRRLRVCWVAYALADCMGAFVVLDAMKSSHPIDCLKKKNWRRFEDTNRSQ